MFSRTFLIITICVSSLFCLAADDPAVPNRVAYITTTPDINTAARTKIETLFSTKSTDADVLAFFDDSVICGPGLWSQIRENAAIANSANGQVHFVIPRYDADGTRAGETKAEGRFFRNGPDVLTLWKAMTGDADFKTLQIRKLTSQELSVFWSMISFKITEPVFVAEFSGKKILLFFASPEKLRVMWMDDFETTAPHDPDVAAVKPAEGPPKMHPKTIYPTTRP